jgi:hypothetical protein
LALGNSKNKSKTETKGEKTKSPKNNNQKNTKSDWSSLAQEKKFAAPQNAGKLPRSHFNLQSQVEAILPFREALTVIRNAEKNGDGNSGNSGGGGGNTNLQIVSSLEDIAKKEPEESDDEGSKDAKDSSKTKGTPKKGFSTSNVEIRNKTRLKAIQATPWNSEKTTLIWAKATIIEIYGDNPHNTCAKLDFGGGIVDVISFGCIVGEEEVSC